jgi:hypothetical protein
MSQNTIKKLAIENIKEAEHRKDRYFTFSIEDKMYRLWVVERGGFYYPGYVNHVWIKNQNVCKFCKDNPNHLNNKCEILSELNIEIFKYIINKKEMRLNWLYTPYRLEQAPPPERIRKKR